MSLAEIKRCAGCKVMEKEIVPIGGIICSTKNFVLTQNIEIPLEGCFTIQSKLHIKSINDFDEKQQLELMKLLAKTRKAMQELEISEEVTIFQEEKCNHFHISLVPFYDWMEEKFGHGIDYLELIYKHVKGLALPEDNYVIADVVKKMQEYFKENTKKKTTKK